MTRVIQPPYQLIEFSGGGLNLGGYAQVKGFLPLVTLLTSIGGLRIGGRTSALTPVGDRGGLRLGGRARVLSLIGQYSPALARFGSTTGMIAVVNSPNSQGSQYLPDIGFPFPLYGSTYQNNIAISSNWALLFGFNLLAATDISRTVPGQAFLMAASRARSWDRVLVKADNSFSYRIRFETQISFGSNPVFNTFEVTLYSDGSIQLVCGTSFDLYGYFGAPRVRSLTKGDNVSYADFDRPYPYSPDTDSISAGVEISFVFTPDDTAANSHTVRVGSYPALAPKISRGGLLLGGYSVAIPPISDTIASIGGLRLGGRKFAQPVTGTYSPAVAVMGGRSGMTQVVSSFADDASQYLPDIGFPFPIYGTYYQSNISICSNSYLLFGALLTDTYFSHNYPGRGLFIGARDGSWQNIYVKADSANAYRIRFEGRHTYSTNGATFIFEVTLFSDGAIQLVLGTGYDSGFYPSQSLRSLSKGDGNSYADYPYTSGGIALYGFTDDSVLTSFVFTPDEATRTSHTVQPGSYLRNAAPTAPIPSTAIGGLLLGGIAKVIPAQSSIGGLKLGGRSSAPFTSAFSLSSAIVQPQILAGALSVGVVPAGLSGAISQPQTLSGLMAIGSALSAPINQPQTIAGNISVGVAIAGAISQTQSITGLLLVNKALAGGVSQPQILTGSVTASSGLNAPITQPQSLTGSLSIGNALIGGVTQTQNLAGALNVSSALSAPINQPQTIAGNLSIGNALIGSVTQDQTLSGLLAISSALSASITQPQTIAGNLSLAAFLSGITSQPQVLVGGLSVAAPLASNISQSQTLSGSLSVSKSLTSSISQTQTLIGGLNVIAPLVGNISQPQSLSGLFSSLPSGLSSAIVQLQSLAGNLSVAPPLQSETTSWISRVQGLGGQPTTVGTAAVDAFFVAIKSSTYFSKIKLLHLFGGTTTIASAMAPLLHPTNTAASLSGFSSSDYTASGSGAGIQGNGTGYIDHNYSPFGSSPGFDSAFGTYSKSSVATGAYDLGYVVSGSARLLLSIRYDNSTSFTDSFDQYNGRINTTPPAGVVFALASRISASDFRYYYNGSQVAIDTLTVSTMPSTVIKFYSFYGGLTSGFSPSPLKLTFSFASTGLTPTEVSAFSTAVSDLIGAI